MRRNFIATWHLGFSPTPGSHEIHSSNWLCKVCRQEIVALNTYHPANSRMISFSSNENIVNRCLQMFKGNFLGEKGAYPSLERVA